IILFLALLACRDRRSDGNVIEVRKDTAGLSHKDTVGLSDELRSKIIEYQQRYPSPTSKELYVYIAAFFTKKSDTLVSIWRSGQGVVALKEQVLLGPYSDEKLNPTVIKDSKEL